MILLYLLKINYNEVKKDSFYNRFLINYFIISA